MKHWIFLAIAFVFITQSAAPAANNDSPVGTWQTSWAGPHSDPAVCYLVFSNDFTWSGYGISLKSFGPITIIGTWGTNSIGTIIGAFTEFLPDDTIAATIEGTVKGNKLRARAQINNDRIAIKGGQLAAVPDISSNWVAEVRVHGNTSFQSYTLTASTNLAGWFDITGSGLGQSGTYTLSGAIIVTSDRLANAYITSDFGSGGTTSVWSFAGRFKSSGDRANFRGHDDTGHDLIIKIER